MSNSNSWKLETIKKGSEIILNISNNKSVNCSLIYLIK